MKGLKKLAAILLSMVLVFECFLPAAAGSNSDGAQKPAVPADFRATDITSANVALAWTDASNNAGTVSYVLSYNLANEKQTEQNQKTVTDAVYGDAIDKISVSLDASAFETVEVHDNSYTVTGLMPETAYSFSIRAKDAAGSLSEAAEIEVTTKADNSIEDNSSDATDRYIVKYKETRGDKGEGGREKFKKKLGANIKKSKRFKNKNMDVIILNNKQKPDKFKSDLKKNKSDEDIEYIQPDYKLTLSSNDTYFNNQWGLQNGTEGLLTNNQSEQINYIDDDRLKEVVSEILQDRLQTNRLVDSLRMLPVENQQYRSAIEGLEVKCSKKEQIGADEILNIMSTYVQNDRNLLSLMRCAVSNPEFEMFIQKRISSLTQPNTLLNQMQYAADAKVVPAWEQSQGGGVTVAVIDTGIDITHEDLAENIYTNRLEIPGDGIDNDGNGYVDDVNGWNFVDDNSLVHDTAVASDEVHGTNAAGIIAAVKDNGKGIAGAAPQAKVLPLKVFKNGTAYTSDIIEAIDYAEKMGIKIVNCSWGSSNDNQALKEAISNSSMLFVCAAGNSSTNIDANPVYPASYDCPNIITVASINRNGALSSFSNYGENSVDVAAPGEEIYSTALENAYGQNSGTSMAAPFVTAEAAILLSRNSGMSTADLKDRIINTSDRLSSLTGKVFRGNKVNFSNGVNNIVNDEIVSVSTSNVQQAAIVNNQTSGDYSLFSTPTVTGQFVKVACGNSHTVALKNDGTVWAWGYNGFGQLGNGIPTNEAVPVQVNSLSGITAIACGGRHTIALKNDGTVWTCGNNGSGQLGDGTTVDRYTPVQVSGLSGITAIAGGNYFTIALRNDGTVWTWGYNDKGQLGDGTTTQRTAPVQVSNLSGITAIAGGGYHTIALKNDGTVWTWGYNNYGQLGDGTTTQRTIPVQVSGLTGITAIAGGYNHTIALKNDGTVWAWGYNGYGQLGDGTSTNKTTPVQVYGLSGITAIASGYYHVMAIKNDGMVWVFGSNTSGQLGDGTLTRENKPIKVSGLSGTIAIAGGDSHSIAIKNDGTVWAWGRKSEGQLGDGIVISKSTPVQANGPNAVISIACGFSHSIELRNDGTVWAYGYNEFGQLGDGTTLPRTSPIQASGLNGITAIACGYKSSMVLKNDGTVWSWGSNIYGKLGDGTTEDRYTPVQVSGLSGITAIAGGYNHTIALKNDGTVWTWGYNDYGQLGDGTTTQRTIPMQVSGLTGITAIAGGYNHTIALKNDGTVWTWGYNNYGQLGDGTTTQRTIPVQVSGLTGITAIAGGYNHTIALKNDGTVWAWGNNDIGQLGDGTTIGKSTPVQVNGLCGISAIAGGYYHTVALKNDETVWTWGDNDKGQLGDGTMTQRSIPVQVSGLSGVASIAGGAYHTLALKRDGTVWAWGFNYYGQLGNGESAFALTPEWVCGTPSTPGLNVNVNATNGKMFNFCIKASNIKDFTKYQFQITYNPSELDVVDLCSGTASKELSAIPISGTGITITQYDTANGVITFTVNKTIGENMSWSGIVNAIRFKAKIDGQTAITVSY